MVPDQVVQEGQIDDADDDDKKEDDDTGDEETKQQPQQPQNLVGVLSQTEILCRRQINEFFFCSHGPTAVTVPSDGLYAFVHEINYFQQRMNAAVATRTSTTTTTNSHEDYASISRIDCVRLRLDTTDLFQKVGEERISSIETTLASMGKASLTMEELQDIVVDLPTPSNIRTTLFPLFESFGQVLAVLPNLDFVIIEVRDEIGKEVLIPLLLGLAQSQNHMSELRIHCSIFLTEEDAQALHTTLLHQNFPRLEELSLRLRTNSLNRIISSALWLPGCSLSSQLKSLELNSLSSRDSNNTLEPLIAALANNHTLQRVMLRNFHWTVNLSHTLRQSLENQSSITTLCLTPYELDDDLWRRAMGFLRTNTTLQSVTIGKFLPTAGDPTLSVPTVLETLQQVTANDHSSLQSLTLDCRSVQARDYIQAIEVLVNNTTLRHFHCQWSVIAFDNDEYQQLVLAARQNYGIRNYHLQTLFLESNEPPFELQLIETLNGAGRCYLQDDATSKERAIQVFRNVQNNLNAIYYHLLENPAICS